ncbi:HK97-gp10 family putative phage morphogenesis protein [Algoriphagus sp. D3-2-R+10]|uniref:HK97-gp10 family putative phage morphogenesis protein n=1 Tax=Algoriphagus aurantiacus TaxID=3103948 RepID=UPI002B3A74C2|nr:HK97-gp10 family putative phage morphogenesis protein [Algoriphagus sp. D3-2-R+10]MEB2775230.1 HK97-gp10 family putative phage morphogenesis protein [Algoriphagus sp. D3-2-R+10]
MNNFDIDLRGEKELIAQLKKLNNKMAVTEIKKALRKAGHKIKTAVKSEAPIGESGELKKSIKVFADGSYGSKNGALIRVGADRKIAPHAHLVEFGTEERELNKPNTIRLASGEYFRITHTGKMPANNFFERGYESSKNEAIDIFTNEIKKVINSAT